MFKKLILLFFIVAPISIFAQDKIAYINSSEVFSKMPELKNIQEQIKAQEDDMKKRAADIEAEFTTLAEKFSKDTTALSESIVLDRQNQLEALRQRYQSFVQTRTAEIEKSYQELMAPLQQKMMKAVKDVGDENNYVYILDAAAILHVGANAVDAGPLVKAKLGITD